MILSENRSKYRVVFVSPEGQALEWRRILKATLSQRIKDLGLSPETDCQFLEPRNVDELVEKLDTPAPLAAIYFGSPVQSEGATAVVKELQRRSAFVLPLVSSLKTFQAEVPESLYLVNGMEPHAQDLGLDSVAARLLEELRLLRERRKVFVSYRRADSSAVAHQLFQRLDERSFRVFLDTFSVPYGRNFQEELLDNLTDTDVLVLLDTPGVSSSKWVQEEITQANKLGLGVLQLIWPNNKRAREAEMSSPIYLETKDFEGEPPSPDASSRLKTEVLDRLVANVEAVRARNLAARRTRVVEKFCARAHAAGLACELQPSSYIELHDQEDPSRRRSRVFPVVGPPEATQFETAHPQCEGSIGCLVYDAIGVLKKRKTHLDWLNQYLPVHSKSVNEIDEWLNKLK
jgi:TIR domain-containing protein